MTKFSTFLLKKMHLLSRRFCYSTNAQLLRALVHRRQGQRYQDKGKMERTAARSRLLQPIPSLLHAPSRAAWVCLPHFSPLNSCTESLCAKQTSKPCWSLPKDTADWIWHANRRSHKPEHLRGRFLSPPSFHKDTAIMWNQKAACNSFCTLLVSKQTALLPLRCHLNVISSTMEQIQGRKNVNREKKMPNCFCSSTFSAPEASLLQGHNSAKTA